MAQCSIWDNGKQCGETAVFWVTCRRHSPPLMIFPAGAGAGYSYGTKRPSPANDGGGDGGDGGVRGSRKSDPDDNPDFPEGGPGGGAVPEAESESSLVPALSAASSIASLLNTVLPHIARHIHSLGPLIHGQDQTVLTDELEELALITAEINEGGDNMDQATSAAFNKRLAAVFYACGQELNAQVSTLQGITGVVDEAIVKIGVEYEQDVHNAPMGQVAREPEAAKSMVAGGGWVRRED